MVLPSHFGGDVISNGRGVFNESFIPSSGFRDQMKRQSGRRPEKCAYLPSRYVNPDFAVLDNPQISFYTYWKNEVLAGRFFPADIGYANLLVSEILCGEDPPRKKLQEIRAISEKSTDIGIPPESMDGVVFDLCVSNNVPLPFPNHTVNSRYTAVLMTDLFSSPPAYLSAERIHRLTGMNVPEDPLIIDRVNAVLQAYDRHLVDTEGIGVFAKYGGQDFPITHQLFADRPFMCGPNVVFTNLKVDLKGDLLRIVSSVTRSVMSRNLEFVRELDPFICRFVEEALDDRIKAEFVLRSEPAYKTSGEDATAPLRIFPSGEYDAKSMWSDMKSNWERYSNEPSQYEPSNNGHITYSCMSLAQRKYYNYWKNRLREGEYLPTDNGYIWLFASEQIAFCPNRRAVYDRLLGISKKYPCGSIPWIRTVCSDYAIINGFPLPYPGTSPEMKSLALSRYLKGEDVRMDPSDTLQALGIDSAKIASGFGHESNSIFLRSLRSIQEKTGPILETFRCMNKPYKLHAYDSIKAVQTGNGMFQWVDCPRLWNNDELHRFAEDLIRQSITLVEKKKPARLPAVQLKGIDCVEILERTARTEDAEHAPKRMIAELDFRAVDKAEDDLNEVTELMMTDEEQDDPHEGTQQEPSQPTCTGTGDVWKDFISSLDGPQKDYILLALEGKLPKADRKLEDSINDVALATVQDTVIEDGRVFEDYADDIRGGF